MATVKSEYRWAAFNFNCYLIVSWGRFGFVFLQYFHIFFAITLVFKKKFPGIPCHFCSSKNGICCSVFKKDSTIIECCRHFRGMGIDLKSRCGAQQKDQILSEKKRNFFLCGTSWKFYKGYCHKKEDEIGITQILSHRLSFCTPASCIQRSVAKLQQHWSKKPLMVMSFTWLLH